MPFRIQGTGTTDDVRVTLVPKELLGFGRYTWKVLVTKIIKQTYWAIKKTTREVNRPGERTDLHKQRVIKRPHQ